MRLRERAGAKILGEAADLHEAGEGLSVRVERRNGFDQAGDGERIAHPAGPADEMDGTAFAGKLDGNAHERRDSGTINLRYSVEVDHYLTAAALYKGLKRCIELLARLADREPTVDLQQVNSVGFTDGNLHGYMFGHELSFQAERSLPTAEAPTAFGPQALYDPRLALENFSIKKTNSENQNFSR